MGLAALVAVVMIALAIVVAIIYGIFVGLARFGRFLWQALVIADQTEEDAEVADEQPAEKEVVGARQ